MSDLVSWDTLAERGGTVGALVALGLLLSWVTARLARRFERRIVGSPTSEEAARRGRTLAAVLRAAVLGTLRGGLVWRGTVYPVAALRAGVRVKF